MCVRFGVSALQYYRLQFFFRAIIFVNFVVLLYIIFILYIIVIIIYNFSSFLVYVPKNKL
jgi:hypothetical protein